MNVEADSILFFRENTTFIQETGSLQLDGDGRFRGLFDHQGGDISGIVNVDDGGSLAIANAAPAANFLLTRGGDLESNIPAGHVVTLSNPIASATDSYSGIEGLIIDGT